jgi:hypothetical protein
MEKLFGVDEQTKILLDVQPTGQNTAFHFNPLNPNGNYMPQLS